MSLPIGGFMPLPLPMMIPFMAAQSAAMALAFGTYFQYGKRKISSMSNEEFNKLTVESQFTDLTADIRAMIPSLQKSMHTYTSSMTPAIITEFSDLAKQVISEVTTEFSDTFTGGLDLGIQTSKTQINEFITALTTWITAMTAGNNQNFGPGGPLVQQTNVSVTDIELENKLNKIPTPEKFKDTVTIDATRDALLSSITPTQKEYNSYLAEKLAKVKPYYLLKQDQNQNKHAIRNKREAAGSALYANGRNASSLANIKRDLVNLIAFEKILFKRVHEQIRKIQSFGTAKMNHMNPLIRADGKKLRIFPK